jgi:DNA polymerase III alpha subunit
METQAGQPDKRAKAIKELKSFGYEIAKVDINYATEKWSIVDNADGTTHFMPSFLTVKGVGPSAVEEIKRWRPYKSVDDLLWCKDGTWKHSKFNKRAFENLIKIGAFDSTGIVGPSDGTEQKPFKSYRAMHKCLIEDNGKLKHKKNGKKELEKRMSESADISEWSKKERIIFSKDLVGSFDVNLVLSSKIRDKLDELKVQVIDDFDVEKSSTQLCWFIIENTTPRLTKNGKEYLLIEVTGLMGKAYKIYCWGWNPDKHDVQKNQAYVGELQKSQFGFSTQIFKIKAVGEKKTNQDND